MQTVKDNSKDIKETEEAKDKAKETDEVKDKSEETTEAKDETKDKSEDEINNTEDIPLENNLELTSMSRKEKKAIRKARIAEFTKDMTKKEKINYFLYYNKWKFIVAIIAVIFITSTVSTIIKNNRPVALSYAVINNNSMNEPNSEVFKEYLKYYNFSDSYQIRSDTEYHLTYDEYINGTMNANDTASYQYFPVRCDENYYDIVFSDKDGIDYCLETYLLLPVENVLPADLISEINQKYPDCICGIKNDSGTLTGYYIDISDTDFAKKLNLTYEDTFICFPGTSSKNEANTIKIVKYIMKLDYEIN